MGTPKGWGKETEKPMETGPEWGSPPAWAMATQMGLAQASGFRRAWGRDSARVKGCRPA
jgi:hypothetical protein